MADEQIKEQAKTAEDLPLNPDLMGYPTVEALVNAKRASDAEARRIVEENRSLKDQMAQNAYRPEVNPRQAVPHRQSAQDRLTELGVPYDAIQDVIREEINGAFQPILAGVNARSTIQGRYPDYSKFESDVNNFIQSDPELNQSYQKMFAADPVGAFEYAFLKFGQSRRESISQKNGTSGEDAVHASIPGGRNGESRRTVQNQDSNVQRTWEQYQKTGSTRDARAYAQARLHNVVTDEHLNQ